jgi:DNA (cytosine-5)-methyltransferase 1
MGKEGKRYRVLDLFAGCGGLSQGFEQAGFEIVAGNDILEYVGKTYQRNHPKTRFFLGDIRDKSVKEQIISYMNDKGCDVIIGGPPCQAYSIAGLRNPEDPRGRLFEEFVEIVEKLQPKLFVMENVKGILTMKHNKENLTDKEKKELQELRDIEKERNELLLFRKQSKNNHKKYKFTEDDERRLDELKEKVKSLKRDLGSYQEKVTDKLLRSFNHLGYEVKFKILNSADFGVPQKRERVIFIGKKNGKITHPEPTHSEEGKENLKKWVTVKEAIGDLEDRGEDIKFNHIMTSHNKDFLEKIENTPMGKSVFGNYSDSFFKVYPNQPSRTVKENHGGVFVHYKNKRVMTPRELARLQSFPDNFIFEGSKSQQLVQLGNAVPVKLAKAVAEHIKKLLDKDS